MYEEFDAETEQRDLLVGRGPEGRCSAECNVEEIHLQNKDWRDKWNKRSNEVCVNHQLLKRRVR